MANIVPKLHKPEYRIIFYNKITRGIMKYKFKSYESALNFFDKLDPIISKPVMYEIKRIH